MKRRPLPKTLPQWLKEVKDAILEARESTDSSSPWVKDLFQQAPYMCFRFRGQQLSEEGEEQAVRFAFASTLAVDGKNGIKFAASRPKLAFAVCFISTHVVLKLINEEEGKKIIKFCEKSVKKLATA